MGRGGNDTVISRESLFTRGSTSESKPSQEQQELEPTDFDSSIKSMNNRIFYTGSSRPVGDIDTKRSRAEGNLGKGIYGTSQIEIASDYAIASSGGIELNREKPGIVSAYRYNFSSGGVIDFNKGLTPKFKKALDSWSLDVAKTLEMTSEFNLVKKDYLKNKTSLSNEDYFHAVLGAVRYILYEKVKNLSNPDEAFQEEFSKLQDAWVKIAVKHGIEAITKKGATGNMRRPYTGDHQEVVVLDKSKIIEIEEVTPVDAYEKEVID